MGISYWLPLFVSYVLGNDITGIVLWKGCDAVNSNQSPIGNLMDKQSFFVSNYSLLNEMNVEALIGGTQAGPVSFNLWSVTRGNALITTRTEGTFRFYLFGDSAPTCGTWSPVPIYEDIYHLQVNSTLEAPITTFEMDFQLTSVNTRFRCLGGLLYVRSANCLSGHNTTAIPPVITSLNTDYGRCLSTFVDSSYCGPVFAGWSENVVQNGRGQVAWNSYWTFPAENTNNGGVWTNNGPGLGFSATSTPNQFAVRTQLIDLLGLGYSQTFLDSHPTLLFVATLAPTPNPTPGSIDTYSYSVLLANSSSPVYYGSPVVGQPSISGVRVINITIPTGGGTLRYIFLQEGLRDDKGPSGPTILNVAIYLNLNECEVGNGGCDPQRLCIDRLNGPPTCGACNSGYTLNGTVCQKNDPCLDVSPCPPLATCSSSLPDRIKTCTCPPGFSNATGTCADIDECGGNNGNCVGGTCINVFGANSSTPVCLPIPQACSLQLGTGPRNCSLLLADTNSTHNLSVLLNTTTSLTLGGAFFGPIADPFRFNCNATASVTGISARCFPPAGVYGVSLGFTFVFCSPSQGLCFNVNFRSAGVFSHPVPIFNPGSLKFHPSGIPTTNLNATNNAGGETVSFTGNFFAAAQFRFLPSNRVQYRSATNVTYQCPLLAGGSSTLIICLIQAGQGALFRFDIVWDGVIVATSTDTFSYPVTPTITAVWGCSNNSADGTTSNCPTSTSIPTIITIQGSIFPAQPFVTVSGLTCNDVNVTNSSLLTCRLPDGVGLLNPVVVSSGLFLSLPSFAVSYALPSISSVVGCSGDFVSSLTTTECNRDGTSILTVTGNNFGSRIPTVTVGGVKCTNVSIVVAHSQVTCRLPQVLDPFNNVVLQQFDGQESLPPYPTVGYKQCPPGTSNAAVSCDPCPAGTFSASAGQNCGACPLGDAPDITATSCEICLEGKAAIGGVCVNCGPGSFSDRQGMAACDTCPPGTYSTEVSNNRCELCLPGQFQGSPGQATCTNCTAGRFANFYGFSICDQCQAGKYVNETGVVGCIPCDLGYSQPSEGQLLCLACAVGRQAAVKGQSSCDACASGRYAVNNGTANCALCSPGFFQSGVGKTSCSPCAFGTQAPLQGSAVCTNCLAGTFGLFNAITGTPACLPCNAGFSQTAPSQSSCSICAPGTYSAPGASTCKQCQPGYYSASVAASECQQCPLGAKPDFMFATCLCPKGTFSQFYNASGNNSDGMRCITCPTGAVCTSVGVTELTLATESGWWRAPGTLHFYRCRFPELCLGGVGNVCDVAREGPLCAVCISQYSSNGPGKPCTVCPAQNAAWGETIGIMLLVLAAILVLMIIMLRYSNMQQRALIALTKANDVAALEQMQTALKEYDVGDEYFEQLRAMQKGGETDDTYDEEEETSPPALPGGAPPEERELPSAVLPPVIPHAAHEDFKEGGGWVKNVRSAYKSAMEKGKVAGMLDAFVLESTQQLKNKLRRAPNFIYKVKILLGFFQVATIMPLNGTVNWPLYWTRFISAFSFFNFDFIPWSSLSCATSISYLDKALIIGCVPIVAVILIAIVVVLWDKSTYKYGVETQMEVQMHQRQVWRQFTKLVLFTVFLLYPFSSKVTLGVYNCVTVESETYVAADFTLNCSDPYYVRTAGINAIFVLLYPIGVPCACFYLLYRNLHRLREPEIVLQFGFLYDAYTDERWFWEIIDMTHKLCLTSITLFLPANAVMPTNMCIVVLYLMGLVLANPYIRKGDDRFHLLVQVNLYLLALIGLILITIENPYRTEVADEETMIILLSCLLIFMNIGLFIGFFVIAGRNALKIIRGNKKGGGKKSASFEPATLAHR